eukprot:CAMPEP_0201517906 /NCGR_PEP_ID=MMETSP0161_2-20130828/8882_1 /ASSEMBLY_ACC=CAM_ASM_000251 /TAXON_ID=180227 /ORGANISM="Neoparamoeba aestuarina, Strain SoJaBio B1-5/56/2" /LENGTH=566 /DNA_ID=CAMNT_0047915535 /DNA_START=149 /DNA_END=1849 /DNA_ORIENTATION=+
MPAPVPSHPSQRPPASIANIPNRSQSVPALLRPTGQYQYVVPPRISQTPPPSKNIASKDEIKAAIASIDHVLIAALGNPKDRPTLTKLETDVQNFLRNPQMTRLDFPPMSSYQRLMAHRIAEYYHMEHTVVDLDNSRRAVVLFKTAGSRCPDVQLCNIPEEDAALASGKSPVNNGNNPSVTPPGVILQDPVILAAPVIPDANSGSIKEEEVFEENSSYEPDPDMPPLVTSEPPKQFKLLKRKPSPSPGAPKGTERLSSSGSDSSGESKGENSEKSLEEREKDYALARARIFNYENLDGTAAAELAGLTLGDPSQSSPTRDPSLENQNPRPDQSPDRDSPVNNNRFPGRNLGTNGNLSRAHSSGSTQYYNTNVRNPRGGSSNYGGLGNPSPTPGQPFNGYAAPFHWGVSGGGRGSPSHGMYVTETGDVNWFPVYTPPENPYNYPYFQPQSRQVPLFVPQNGMSSPVIPPEHSFPQGQIPMGYPGQVPYPRGYAPNQKGRSPPPGNPGNPGNPVLFTPLPTNSLSSPNRSDKSFTPPRVDSPTQNTQYQQQQQQQQQQQHPQPPSPNQ